jgi:hypothetical protein
MVGEGFQGKLRLKLVRLFFLLVAGIALSFFWYYPHVLTKIIILSHVQSAWSQFQSVLPLAIPVIPVAGALSFLIFDRREKLKPIFISLSLFVCYLSLYSVSSDLNISGIFTADRYLPELVFCSSFFLSILLVLLIELSLRSVLPKIKGKFASFVLTALVTFSVVVVGFLTLRGVTIVHAYIVRGVVVDHYQVGIGNIAPVFDWRDPSSLIADFISVATLLLLLYFVRKYPSHKTAHFH